MRKVFVLMLGGLAIVALETEAAAQVSLDLVMEPPTCKTPPAKRPKLHAERGSESKGAIETGWYSPLVADFNGDGWCDFAWAVPYPMNSKMESYFLDEIMTLGGPKRWRPPLKETGATLFGSDFRVSPDQNVDLTEVTMIYPKSGGAPYVLGIGPDGLEYVALGCREYVSVHRWDNEVDAFKKVDDVTRDAVITFYYSTVGQRCDRSKK
ncbi:hypothetical protein JNX00_06920 [Hydrogenophaga sp. YM1]|uniref:FG-GAP repeat protein n=1 Tax=Hydrogenophaga sp. YM1 TaxID=2806262 RepID=UPI00195A9E16|nr:FG-GAP repeat protein [Hydrogenophaga sp. YM1]QRR35590.1 hypothetical protein JNX00_06920 [Hydrogenophaga sp. YM1]